MDMVVIGTKFNSEYSEKHGIIESNKLMEIVP